MKKRPIKRHHTPKKPAPAKKISLTVSDVTSQGIGTAILDKDKKQTEVLYGLPGETVEAFVMHEGYKSIHAVTSKVIENRHPQRIRSSCSIHTRCQSCLLIHTGSPYQITFKDTIVKNALKDVPEIKSSKQLPLIPSPDTIGYRTNAKLAFGVENRKVVLGVFKRHTHDIISTLNCPVHHPLINTISQIVHEEVLHQKISIYNSKHGRGLLRYLIIKVSPHTETAMITFVTAYRDIPTITRLAKWVVRKLPQVLSVFQNINSSQGNVIFGQSTLKMFGKPIFVDRLNNFSVGLLPTSFFQVNHKQAEQMYSLISSWAGENRYSAVIDLYCGIGGIALHLAHLSPKVIGIEYVQEAVINAQNNARHNGFDNCRFFTGDATETLSVQQRSIPEGALITLNPPRKGCDAELLNLVAELKPAKLIYISCNPEALARDLNHLSPLGYKPNRIQPLDMFPQTEHVETVVEILPNNQ